MHLSRIQNAGTLSIQSTVLVTFSLLCIVCACTQKPAQQSVQVSNATVGLPEGFNDFYDQFHADSLYQIAHIVWPLAGKTNVQIDSTKSMVVDTAWLPEYWHMHRPVPFDKGEYRRQVEQLGDVLVIERILTQVGNFGLERRFAKSPSGEWELIYYSDMIEH
ncbi:MAG: hypothetical protein ACOYNO_02975 [Saprospiraceae bacterium]